MMKDLSDIQQAGALWSVDVHGMIPSDLARRTWDDSHVEQVKVCMALIGTGVFRFRLAWGSVTSYDYKHRVEHLSAAIGQGMYIANGAFIVAACMFGLDVKPAQQGSPNAVFRDQRLTRWYRTDWSSR